MSGTTGFLLLLLIIGLLGKNVSITVAVGFLLIINWLGFGQKVYPFLQGQGLNIGITVITIAILVPIASGHITLQDLWSSMKSTYGLVALFSGLVVAILGGFGVKLLADDPQVTIALVLGTILAVTFLKGVAVGPLIGAGIAYLIMKAVQFFH
ncbi:DUF441 domain-containing protein [Bacillus horti]|uniref:UPF0756 membrane protein J2S11_000079 n=1 Tax=Caldalkalibacillus horti TaxID=77523 RepID=A0ABT9VTG5_9BACI|nr:DUF441 domain-containing protein [Bacillus horti]MDQ0164180.1 uncharacterized membrane protein (DUF441 family) [Bacillus horti]